MEFLLIPIPSKHRILPRQACRKGFDIGSARLRYARNARLWVAVWEFPQLCITTIVCVCVTLLHADVAGKTAAAPPLPCLAATQPLIALPTESRLERVPAAIHF